MKRLIRRRFAGKWEKLFTIKKRIMNWIVQLFGVKNLSSWIPQNLTSGTLLPFLMMKTAHIKKPLNSIKKPSNWIRRILLHITTALFPTNPWAKCKNAKNSTEKPSKSIPATFTPGTISETSTKTKMTTNKLLNSTNMPSNTTPHTLLHLRILEFALSKPTSTKKPSSISPWLKKPYQTTKMHWAQETKPF